MAKRGKASKTKTPANVKLLIENNVALQKVFSMLASEINSLTKRLDRFMQLVEKASEKYASSPPSVSPASPLVETESKREVTQIQMPAEKEELINKLESLLKQNKTIARGLILLERYVRDRLKPSKSAKLPSEGKIKPKPLPEVKF